MSHNSGGVTKLGENIVSKSEDSPLNDDEGNVGGLNYTPCRVKPIMVLILFHIFRSYSPSVVNLYFNLGTPPLPKKI
jgi:hypothetical protein